MNILEDCTMDRLEADRDLSAFQCSNEDLNDFLKSDAINYSNKLLGTTYLFVKDVVEEGQKDIVCFFTISNDAVNVKLMNNGAIKKLMKKLEIPSSKRMKGYPSVKIGRIGVDESYARNGIGSQILDFIKGWFLDDENKTGCRMVTVDAYNEDHVLKFYLANGFDYLLTEEKEAEQMGIAKEELRTRMMYFDLLTF